jgi:hypothetical protein
MHPRKYMKMMINTTVCESMASRFTEVTETAQRSPPKIVPALDLSRRRRRAVGLAADLGVIA